MENSNRFTLIRFVCKWGYLLPWLAAALLLAAGIALSYCSGTPLWTVLGVIAAVLAAAGLRLAVELVDLVAETLLPR